MTRDGQYFSMVQTPTQATDTTWRSSGPIPDFGQWADHVAQSYTALTVRQSRSRDDLPRFAGSIAERHLAQATTLSQITAMPQDVRRRRGDIRSSPSESIFVNIQISGTCKVSQAGMDTLQKPGSVMLLDARRPFSMQFDAPFRQLCLHLPLEGLSGKGQDITNSAGRVLRRDDPGAGTLFRMATASGPIELTALIALLEEIYGATPDHRLSDDHLALILSHMKRHLADPDLGVESTARQFGISRRYIHRLFARTGTTFGKHLLATRLAAAHDRILAGEGCPVSQLAHDCGFRSASHFSNAYKAAYGMAPSLAVGQNH
jgi:AraC-like DNA-binding protein